MHNVCVANSGLEMSVCLVILYNVEIGHAVRSVAVVIYY